MRPVLSAFSRRHDGQSSNGAGAQLGQPSGQVAAGLVEPLTSRELEILALLREPLSGKEIARKLTISTATFKRHASNIYGKLGVHRRWDAVAIAESLGVLARR
jgi:LuxR family maltose regulon positive regulatory protein